MDNKLITGIIGVVVVVALLGSALVPVIDGLTEGEKTTNEGAGWLRMDYVTGANYDANVCFDPQGNIRVDAGVPGSGIVNTQTHAADEDTILFASSEVTMWLQDGAINILGKDSDGNVFFDQITEIGPIATVMRDGTGSQFSIDTDVPTQLNASSWAYVPKSTGNFGFFDAGTPVDMKSYPIAAVGGGFAGVFGYNDLQTYGLGLYLQTDLDEDGKLIGGTWVKTAPEQLNTMEFDPSTITIQPLDPSIIDLDPIDFGGGAQLMSLPPTPTYTDGDWGYELNNDKATIVSYSGPGGGPITVPATVGGYEVTTVGNGSVAIFDTSMAATDLTISSGITTINNNAFKSCNLFTGRITIPSTVTDINGYAFNGCSGFTSIILSEGLQTIGNNVFANCLGLTGTLTIPSTVTTIGGSSFYKCSGLNKLNLSEGLTSTGSSSFIKCSGLTGTIYVPSSLTSLGAYTFSDCTSVTGLVINTNATPGSTPFSNMTSLTGVLDLSDTIDYNTDRYGIPAGVEVSESIGDVIGYVSFVEIGTDAELSGGAAALLIAVPIVVIAGLLVAFVGYSIVKRY